VVWLAEGKVSEKRAVRNFRAEVMSWDPEGLYGVEGGEISKGH
jgi:hypothetical protein